MTNLISVFLPIYNEDQILADHVQKIAAALANLKYPFEIFIIDDNSLDQSQNIGQELSQNNPQIKYLRFNQGPSRRENMASAFKEARAEIIIFMDLDLSTDLKHMAQLINEIESGYDIAIGSRYLEIKPGREFYRKTLSHLYNAFIRLIFQSKIRDHQCGFKAFKKDAIVSLVEEMGYDQAFKRGWLWDAEMLIRAQHKGLKIKEFAVNWRRSKQSSFKFFRELKVIPFAIRLKRKLPKI